MCTSKVNQSIIIVHHRSNVNRSTVIAISNIIIPFQYEKVFKG